MVRVVFHHSSRSIALRRALQQAFLLGAFLAAFLSPVTAIIAAAVSYRAVVTGPRVQMRIAQQQNELAERQQALHEKQSALTERQAHFAGIGASEQKWISDFQEMLAHLFELGFRASRSTD